MYIGLDGKVDFFMITNYKMLLIYSRNRNNYINYMISQYGGSDNTTYNPIIESIRRLDLHKQPSPINLIDMNYSDADKLLMSRIDIQTPNTFDHYGYIDPMDIKIHGIKEFINNIGDNHTISDQLICLIGRLVSSVIIGAGKKNHIWLTIRASLPNNNYDEQRWHIDGKFYTSDDKDELFQYKFITIMKGDGTYMLDLKDNDKDIFMNKLHSRQYIDDYKQNKKDLHDMYKDYPRLQLTNDQGVVLIVGSNNLHLNTIHSEPPVKHPRFFLSILTGTESELKNLYDRRSAHMTNMVKWHPQYKSIDSENTDSDDFDSSERVSE